MRKPAEPEQSEPDISVRVVATVELSAAVVERAICHYLAHVLAGSNGVPVPARIDQMQVSIQSDADEKLLGARLIYASETQP